MNLTGPFFFALTLPCALAAADLSLLKQKDMQPLFGRLGSARLAALGGSHHALIQGRDALFANPAGLGSLGELEAGLNHESWLGSLNHESAYMAAPLGQHAGFGVYGHVTDFGIYEIRDSAGQKTGEASARDYAVGFGLGFARGPFSYGLALRFVSQNLEAPDTVSVVADLGAGWVSENGWTAGLAYFNAAANSPAQGAERVRWALGRHLQAPWGLSVWPALGFSWVPNSGNRLHAGAELKRGPWAWRFGYQLHFVPSPDASQGFNTGVGYRWGSLSVDYGILPFSGHGPAQTLSLAWSQPLGSWGGVARAKTLDPSLTERKDPPAFKPPSAELQTAVDVLGDAKALESAGRIAEAADAYEQVTKAYPDLAGAWRGVADLRYKLGQNLASLSAYERLLALEPDPSLRAWVDAYRKEVEGSLP